MSHDHKQRMKRERMVASGEMIEAREGQTMRLSRGSAVVMLSAYNRSEIEKRAKEIQCEAKIIISNARNYADNEQNNSSNAIEAIRLHLQAISEYLK